MLILDNAGQVNDDDRLWALEHFAKQERDNDRYGPCEDDPEVTAPYIDGMPDGVLPDEFLSRPLKFGEDYEWERRQAAQKMADEALLNALYASDVDDLFRRAAKLSEADKEFISSVW